MSKTQAAILVTGTPTLTVVIDGDSQVGLSGTFGSVALTDFNGASIRAAADTAAISFGCIANEMVFTLTGTGPVVVTVTPTRVANISKFDLTV